MPIRAERKHLYPRDWPAISARIRERAGNKCEECGVPNHALGGRDDGLFYFAHSIDCSGRKPDLGTYAWCWRKSIYPDVPAQSRYVRIIRIVLTVAHLNHDETDCRDENLKAWCQRCHLSYDAKHHARNAKATIRARKAVGDLFA